MKRDKERRELLLIEIVKKLIKNNLYKLLLPFNIWHKKAMLDKMNEGATKIQNKFREYLARKKAKDEKAIQKCLKLIRMVNTKNLVDVFKQLKVKKDRRDSQTKVLKIILSKKIVFKDKDSVANYFYRWRRINQKAKDKVTKIANAYRAYKAKKERDRLKRLKILIEKYFTK